jgi:hypothetical protein
LVTHKLCTPSELKLVTLFARKEESGNTTQHEVHISLPDGGGPVHTEQHMQYAYGDQSAAPPSNFSDHNAWQPHTTSGVVYPPIPSSAQSIPQHDSSMAIPPVSGHIMPPYGRFPPPNPQPVGPPYAFGTKPPLHPVAAFMDDSYAASSVPPKKAPVPNWLKEELLKKKADLGRPSSGRFEERESMDDDVLYKPPTKADQPDKKSFSPSNSSDEEEEDEMDAARTTEINMEIKRILTEVLLKVCGLVELEWLVYKHVSATVDICLLNRLQMNYLMKLQPKSLTKMKQYLKVCCGLQDLVLCL